VFVGQRTEHEVARWIAVRLSHEDLRLQSAFCRHFDSPEKLSNTEQKQRKTTILDQMGEQCEFIHNPLKPIEAQSTAGAVSAEMSSEREIANSELQSIP
jgi:hypothetical protein